MHRSFFSFDMGRDGQLHCICACVFVSFQHASSNPFSFTYFPFFFLIIHLSIFITFPSLSFPFLPFIHSFVRFFLPSFCHSIHNHLFHPPSALSCQCCHPVCNEGHPREMSLHITLSTRGRFRKREGGRWANNNPSGMRWATG